MTDIENKIDAIKAKIKKFENSRTLMAALFILLGYYIYDSYKEGTAPALYYVVIGALMAADAGIFAYVSVLIRKLVKERKELEQQ